jgi:hypothetical protein
LQNGRRVISSHVEGVVFPVVNGKLLDAQAHGLNDHDVIELAGVKMGYISAVIRMMGR